ncbi:MFS transporter [Pseudonocardia kongjuensis]|uniref:MFS transporter n=1 Tax=Pseudonocardia kongjuensis TaxID=102227 RepID=UPI0031D04C96
MGNFIENYDFVAYAFAASAISANFFPATDQTAALLATLAVFGVPYLVRPLGAIVFGSLGDRVGRKHLLVVTIALMAGCTTLIGLLPTYGTIGVFAPILLVLLRMLQGFGFAGEFAGAATYVMEHSPRTRRGLTAGLMQSGTGLSYPVLAAVALLLGSTLGSEAFNSWGWRIIFLISAPLGLVALYIRRKLTESPEFERLRAHKATSAAPLRESVRTQYRQLVAVTLYLCAYAVGSTMIIVYVPVYLRTTVGLDDQTNRIVSVIVLLAMGLTIPLFGLLVDRLGRRTVRLIATLSLAVIAPLAFSLAVSTGVGGALIGFGLLAVAQGLNFAIAPLTTVESFPAALRYTSAGLAYNITVAIVGGLTPLVVAWIVASTGSSIAPAWFVVALSVLSIFGIVLMRDTSAAATSDMSSGTAVETP